MAPPSVVPSTFAVPTEASDSEHMNNSGDESTREYFPETTDTGGDSDADDIETDGETATTVLGNVKPLLHQRHSKEEHAILINGKAHWMCCKGSARKKVLLRIASELRKLPEVKDLSEADWENHQRVCAIYHGGVEGDGPSMMNW